MSEFKNALIEKYSEWKTIFLSCFVLNILAYGFYITHVTYAVDDYGYIFAKVNHSAHGRWFAGAIYNNLLQSNLVPTLGPLIGITFYILSGMLITEIWNLSQKSRLWVIALFSLHPYLLDGYNFRIASIILSAAYLLASASVYFSTKGKQGLALAVLLFYLALSTYQGVIGFAIAAIMMQVAFVCVRGGFSREAFGEVKKLIYTYSVMLISSIVLYIILTKAIFVLFDIEPNSRIQAGFISSLEQLKEKAAVVGTILFVRLMPMKEFVLPFAGKLAMFIIYVLALITAAGKGPRVIAKAGIIIWLALIPLGAISFMLPLETRDIPWRICLGLVVFFAGMLALTQESNSVAIRKAGLVLGVFLVGYFILNNNKITYMQYLTNQKDLIMGNRIIARMQSLEGYRPGMEIAIVGDTLKEDFTKEGKTNLEIIREFAKYCTERRYSLAVSAFETDWSKYSFLIYYMDLELQRCTEQSLAKAYTFAQSRKQWPDPSSVFIEDGIAVLKLSEPKERPLK